MIWLEVAKRIQNVHIEKDQSMYIPAQYVENQNFNIQSLVVIADIIHAKAKINL